MIVTTYPVAENCPKNSVKASNFVPVVEKNDNTTGSCTSTIHIMIISSTKVSTARSVTTVPKAFAKETPSFRAKMPQRVNSPILGITKEAAYETNTA